ncbi:cyclic-AMP phosphodiesterase [Fomitopsis serialis]|uniref:cyclic-AMP phosphodiesterase n=1 Tax=Fomitopsis serialis TaxID=139415 RepID=UPI0020080AC4|nr:cyclic-AMP phosphodiesterase [Neoantrodia serialis]KAH9925264.1 cyclic-AMP phosphodiesterase [Neoantrodia serialis]
MPSFELIALGCGGGPSEHNLSSYLLKPHDAHWSEGVLALEAGSGIGALGKLLNDEPELFASGQVKNGHSSRTAGEVYSWIKCFSVSHAHLDHISGLALTASTLKGKRTVFGARRCLQNIENLFSGQLWPRLASWKEDDNVPLLLQELPDDAKYHTVFPGISVRMMPLSHGSYEGKGTYHSSAFFIKHNSSEHEFLFFGDVEPDSIASEPHTRDVWRVAAPKIPNTLDTIFIECSYPSGRPDDMLYGHLTPEHLVAELTALAAEVVDVRTRTRQPNSSQEWDEDEEPVHARKRQRRDTEAPSLRGVLAGLKVYVIHCKDDVQGAYTEPVNRVIASQVRALIEAEGLGAEVVGVEQGMKISI